MPSTLSARFVAPPNSVMEIEDVFEDRTTSGHVI